MPVSAPSPVRQRRRRLTALSLVVGGLLLVAMLFKLSERWSAASSVPEMGFKSFLEDSKASQQAFESSGYNKPSKSPAWEVDRQALTFPQALLASSPKAADEPWPLQRAGTTAPHSLRRPALLKRGETAPASAHAGGAWALHLDSFPSEERALQAASALGKRGHPAYIESCQRPGSGTPRYRLRLGPFASRRDASRYAGWFDRTEEHHAHVYRPRRGEADGSSCQRL